MQTWDGNLFDLGMLSRYDVGLNPDHGIKKVIMALIQTVKHEQDEGETKENFDTLKEWMQPVKFELLPR